MIAPPAPGDPERPMLRVGAAASLGLAAITAATFALALVAVPISGANAPGGGLPYPQLATLHRFPRDYAWMCAAMVQLADYVVVAVAVHLAARPERRVYSGIGLAFALASATTLLQAYALQVSVVPVSLAAGETQGLALLTQYNPHGVFIATEELGYVLMSLAMAALVPVFAPVGTPPLVHRDEAALRWVLGAPFIAAILAFGAITSLHGLDRQDRFEVVIITVDWLALIAMGALLGSVFRRRLAG